LPFFHQRSRDPGGSFGTNTSVGPAAIFKFERKHTTQQRPFKSWAMTDSNGRPRDFGQNGHSIVDSSINF
jgi:hypothetical protein